MEKEGFYTILKKLESEEDFNKRREIIKMLGNNSDTFAKLKIVIVLSYKILFLEQVRFKIKKKRARD